MDVTYAKYLRELVAKAAAVDHDCKIFGANSHKYRLNPIVSEKEVRQFEQEYHITLPEEYVFFLTKVANGGAGPCYGLYSLEKLKIYNYDKQNDNSVFIDKSMTQSDWNEKVGSLYDDECTDDEWDRIEREILSGVLVIGTRGCTYDYVLMCKGSETGKIVYDNSDWCVECPPYLTGMMFLDWYEQYFKEIIAGHNVDGYGCRRLGTEQELCAAYQDATDLDTKSEILSSFWRFRTLSEQTIELLMQIEEKELDSVRLSLLLHKDSFKGLSVFEKLLAGENIDAAVWCARGVPKRYQNNYYQSMLRLLYGQTIDKKEKILFFLDDCTCKKAADIVAFAADEQWGENLRKTAIYVMGNCADVLDYTDQFILWMTGSSYWIAHSALQAMIGTKSTSNKLIEAYLWMWDYYKDDNRMRSNLQQAPIVFE